MDPKIIVIITDCLILIAAIALFFTFRKAKKENLKKQIDALYVRFNSIKTIPIPFKLNKVQAMAKRNADTDNSIREYFNKYEETDKHIKVVQDLLNNIDDEINANNFKNVEAGIAEVEEKIRNCELEIKAIDDFLEEFSRKEDEQREYSVVLKEKYRVVKNTINENANVLSIAYNGLIERLEKCEELFASSEEWIYASDYETASKDLAQIDEILDEIKVNANAAPKCVKDTKGVLPVMIDELKREYALTKQRGVYVDHLDIDNKLKAIEATMNDDIKKLISAQTDGIRDHCSESKQVLNELTEALAAENRSFKEVKENNEKAYEHIIDLEKVENYVRVAYDKDSARFGLSDLRPTLKKCRDSIQKYKDRYKRINEELASTLRPASDILTDTDELFDDIERDKKELYSYKTIIDKSTDGETRALSQLTKLQLVVSEVESKIAEYRLPSISNSYAEDLIKARDYISAIRKLTNEIPIDIDKLNSTLDTAIDFIYKFYNNVNNVIGMAIMVENAIVFGNKYRSTFPEVDRELSKAEFQYLNGEYTKALKTAISCMETLFPDNADEKILENV